MQYFSLYRGGGRELELKAMDSIVALMIFCGAELLCGVIAARAIGFVKKYVSAAHRQTEHTSDIDGEGWAVRKNSAREVRARTRLELMYFGVLVQVLI